MKPITHENMNVDFNKFFEAVKELKTELNCKNINPITSIYGYYNTPVIQFKNESLVPKKVKDICYELFFSFFPEGIQASF